GVRVLGSQGGGRGERQQQRQEKVVSHEGSLPERPRAARPRPFEKAIATKNTKKHKKKGRKEKTGLALGLLLIVFLFFFCAFCVFCGYCLLRRRFAEPATASPAVPSPPVSSPGWRPAPTAGGPARNACASRRTTSRIPPASAS